MNDPPERVTISLPPTSELDRETLDQLVADSDFETRSEFIRAAIRRHS